MTRRTRINALSQALMIKLLLEGDSSCREIADEVGLHYTTVREYCTALHRVGAAHVVRYDPDRSGRHVMPVLKLGYGADAVRVRMTGAQRQRLCRQRRKQAVLLGLKPSRKTERQGAAA